MTEGESQASPEGKIDTWEFESHFREYMILLARKGKDGLESIENFPKIIQLNNVWHETLDKMRDETRDGYERWTPIGFREDMRNLILPSVFAIGKQRSDISKSVRAKVTYEVINKEFQRAKKRTGIVGLVGDIHSHPRHLNARNLHERITRELFGSTRLTSRGGGFSAGDLYNMVTQDQFPLVMAVVDGKENFFGFKTRESKNIPVQSILFNKETFEKYWYEKFGIKLSGEVGIRVSVGYRTVNLNKAIAHEHNLVLYKGHSKADLKRIFP
jgi:hypothetical protein